MRQFPINRTNALMLGLVMAGACGVSYGADVPLVFGNEDIAPFSSMKINAQTTTLRTRLPVLCGSAISGGSGSNFNNQINPIFPGYYSNGDFKFGTISGGAQVPVPGIGFWNYRANGLTVQSDGRTSCYVLSATGERKDSPGLFTDAFESGGQFDASISLSVASLPSFSNPYYTYYVDVRIPAAFATFEYRVRDGFDSSVFAFGGSSARHCKVAIGVTTCSSMTSNNVDDPSVVPAGGVQQRYIVQRLLQEGVSLPADINVPVAFAALYFMDGADSNLANNVAAGRNALSDLAPIITAASNMVPNLAEGTGATNLSFVIADDTSETGLPALNASVAIDFNGTLVNAPNLSCAQLDAPQPGEVVRRTCRFDIPVFDPDFATDSDPSKPGIYAPGVHAAVLITATDSRGQTSTRTVPFHVVSGDNDAPTFTLTPLALVGREDPTPTVTCDLSVQPFPPECLGDIADFVTDMRGGSARAYDENAAQVPFFAGVGADGKLSCTSTSPSIFATIVGGQQSPRVTVSGTSARLSYLLSTQPGTADCTISMGAFDPTGAFDYTQAVKTFRISVVN